MSAQSSPANKLDLGPLGNWALAVMVLLLLLAMHGYGGVVHDAQLYTLQALAWLQPDTYGQDVFLRHGSQDQFTVFSPILGTLIGWFGVDRAAALVTGLSTAALLVAAWLLARRIGGVSLAWLSVGVLLVLPSNYGSLSIFHYLERFATPRLLGEACVIAAILSAVAGRWLWSLALVALGMALHPIMTLAGVGFLLCWRWVLPYPRISAVLIAGGLALAAIEAHFVVLGVLPRMDETWYALAMQLTSYLSLGNWIVYDWSRLALALSMLLAGWFMCKEGEVRRICVTVVVTTFLGLIASRLFGDYLQVAMAVQAQPWRVQWLAGFMGALLLPAIFRSCWRHSDLGRITVLLLIAAWLLRDEVNCLPIAVAAALCAALGRHFERELPLRRWYYLGAGALILLAVALLGANVYFDQSMQPSAMTTLAEPVGRYRATLWDFRVQLMLLVGFWLLVCKYRGNLARRFQLGVPAALCLSVLPLAAAEWTADEYDGQAKDLFAEWRTIVQPGNQVLWYDDPTAAWILLRAQSYISPAQALSTLFSRAAAIDADGRALQVRILGLEKGPLDAAASDSQRGANQPLSLAQVCELTDLRYLISRDRVDASPVAVLPPDAMLRYRGLKLYACPSQSSAGAT